jgi:type I restriction enzyme R subunit
MSTDTTEGGLECYITDYLVNENSYIRRESKDYNNLSCLDEEILFVFFETTRPNAIEKIRQFHKDLYRQKIIKRLNDQIQSKVIIEVLIKALGSTA